MSGERPILILTASAGAGHTMAAQAVAAAMAAAAPDQRVEVHDVLAWGTRLFRRLYGGGYAAIIRHAPALMGWLYDRVDCSSRGLGERGRRLVQECLTGRIARHLLHRNPRLVINTHYLPAEIIANLRRRGRLDCPQVIVTTDLETHRIWVQEPAERYYTATELGGAYLATWGVAAERIRVAGIPVRPAFAEVLTPGAVRARLGLSPEGPVVLLLCGALGMGPAEAALRQLLELPRDTQVVAIAGRNERLRRRLAALAGPAGRRVSVIGFTERGHEYMRAADVAVTKPGGLTVSEALVCHLPLVLLDPIPGQETRNSDYLLEHGAALKVNNVRLLRYRVHELLSAPERMARMRAAAAALAKPSAARDIAWDALGLLGRSERVDLTKPAAAQESAGDPG
jgi:processive 1,2-diacylglycerol beta-glucosyltransferase